MLLFLEMCTWKSAHPHCVHENQNPHPNHVDNVQRFLCQMYFFFKKKILVNKRMRHQKKLRCCWLTEFSLLLRGVQTHPVAQASLLSRAARSLVNTRQGGIHQKATDWWELWPCDASIWKTRQRPLPLAAIPPHCLYSSPPASVCLASRGSPSPPPRTHTEPAVRVGWLTATTGCWTSQASKNFQSATGAQQAHSRLGKTWVGLPHPCMDLVCWDCETLPGLI